MQPLSLEERAARGFCLCPHRHTPGRGAGAGGDAANTVACAVHPDGRDLDESERRRLGLLFFDDRRDRHVSWPDAVEAMRQGRYAGAANDDLVMFTWRNLLQLLATLRSPTTAVDPPATQEGADELIAWAGERLDHDQLRWLLVFARGGGSAAMCELFRFAALQGSSDRDL
jgi:hypothetical protein